MNIQLTINGITQKITVSPSETLLNTLRGLGFHGVKFGDEQGLFGRTRLALGGYGKTPLLAMDGTEPDGLEDAARNSYHEAADNWGSADYRMDVAASLAKRCFEQLK